MDIHKIKRCAACGDPLGVHAAIDVTGYLVHPACAGVEDLAVSKPKEQTSTWWEEITRKWWKQ